MDFSTYLTSSSEEINQTIKEVITDWNKQTSINHPEIKKLTNLFMDRISGGKCLRGVLVKLGYELTGSPRNTEILKIAAAYEILHTSLLILDDIIDKSPTRRGKPTIHTVLGNNHYAISQAICLSDLGFFLATKLIADSHFKSNAQTLSLFSSIIMNTILGEMLDSILAKRDNEKTEKDVMTIHKFKTAEYTVTGPLLLGAQLGEAPSGMLAAIKRYGENIGTAFQIHDDLLGTFGDEKVTGKSSYLDSEEGKNTLLFTFAQSNATSAQKKFLTTYYGKSNLTVKKYEAIKNIFQQSGAVKYSQTKAKSYVLKGKRSIPEITTNKVLQNYLTDFADYTITRQK